MKRIVPTGDRLVIKALDDEQITGGGIIIPDTAKKRPSRGEVLAVGTLKDKRIKAGMTVIFTKYAGTPSELNGEDVMVMYEKDILAMVEE